MLRAPLSRKRGIWPTWSGGEITLRARSHGANRAQPYSKRPGVKNGTRRSSRNTTEQSAIQTPTPSLVDQLFPEESKREEEERVRKRREIPRLPLENPLRQTRPVDLRRKPSLEDEPPNVSRARTWLEGADESSQTSVLVLLNASKNLTTEDFIRLIPQGKHMEGWTLEQGDILQVIPGRNLATLEQENFYYLLFSSPLSAFVYQGHATRISRLAAEQTPNALHTALAPKPGFMLNGMDVHAAIQSYTLTAPTQKLNLRQLKPPLSPLVSSLVRNGGYRAILDRPDKMPFEVRLTLDGPQIPMSRVRSVVYASGRERALEWSGGDEVNIKITEYKPNPSLVASSGEDPEQISISRVRTELTQLQWDMAKAEISLSKRYDDDNELTLKKTPNPVYIIGFYTEHAAQSFVRYWHRRPMDRENREWDARNELPPVANVELLW